MGRTIKRRDHRRARPRVREHGQEVTRRHDHATPRQLPTQGLARDLVTPLQVVTAERALRDAAGNVVTCDRRRDVAGDSLPIYARRRTAERALAWLRELDPTGRWEVLECWTRVSTRGGLGRLAHCHLVGPVTLPPVAPTFSASDGTRTER